MNCFYECAVSIGSRHVDQHNRCHLAVLLGFLQEAAAAASVEIQLSRADLLREHHVFWMMARVWLRLNRPLGWGETVQIRTWHRGGAGAVVYRDFDLFVEGVPVGEAVSGWVLADQDSHKMVRADKVEQLKASSGGSLCKDKRLTKLTVPAEMTLAEVRPMHYSDTDINGHVNNARYVEFACDALHLETLEADRFVSALQLGYLAESQPGDQLQLYTGREAELEYVRGTDQAGTAHFDACVTISPWQK